MNVKQDYTATIPEIPDEPIAKIEQDQTQRIFESMLDEMAAAIEVARIKVKSLRLKEATPIDIEFFANKVVLIGQLALDSLKYLTHDGDTHVEVRLEGDNLSAVVHRD